MKSGAQTRYPNMLAGLLGCTLLVSGCTMLGPDFEQPSAPLESKWLATGDKRISAQPAVDARWWRDAFGDPVLDQLVETALQENLSLRSAGLRVLQSQQQLAIAVGNQYPQQQQISGLASKQRENGNTFKEYNLGFNLSWEADFWGSFRRQVESASAALDASVADYDGALVSLVAQVAQTYIQIRTNQSRLDVARTNVELQAESLRIARAKFEAGEVSELDSDQAESLLNNTRADVPALESALQQLKNSLAVLLGKPPQDLTYLLGNKKDIPTAPAVIALGMPQDLIRQRPDIRVAERQMAAQSAQIGVAEAELYPSLSIGGSIGTQAGDTGDLFDNSSEVWNLFGAFQWNVFNYGRLKSNVRLQDALFQQLLVDYQDTVLQAQADVENTIVAYLKSHEQLAAYSRAAAASRRSVKVSSSQYENGLITFNTVITTLSSDAQQQDLLVATQGSVAANLVQVYRALGGGWSVRDNRDPVQLLPVDMKQQMKDRTEDWDGVLQ
jgi:NodT family efflux transporter outer membrane factor (OMF) lipoprotein